ncbi:hypothetical protein NKDENANG_02469 [Candidatus Entotheonellaceae bacterium PAL068K]
MDTISLVSVEPGGAHPLGHPLALPITAANAPGRLEVASREPEESLSGRHRHPPEAEKPVE